jgi:hypothetical protein
MMLAYHQLLPQVKEILETLLQRAEQPDRKHTVRIRLNARAHPWYFSSNEPGLRSRVHEQLAWLAAQGWLRLRWQKYEEGNLLEAVDFIASSNGSFDAFYQFCGRQPRQKQEEALRQLLLNQQPQASWFEAFLSWALEQLDAHRSPLPLNVDDPENNRDILRALDALARLHTPTLERTLSVQVFGNSKRLAELRPQILTLLRTYATESASPQDDDWELLRAYHLHRPQVYMLVAGPLTLEIPPGPLSVSSPPAHVDLTALPTGLGLPDELLRTAHISRCTASAVLTVENLTSFQELLLQRPASLLTILSNGFPSPVLVRFLQRLRAVEPALPFFHWGDLDAGGLDILRHQRRQLGPIQSLGLDIQTFEAYRSAARSLSSDDKELLQDLLTETMLLDHVPLIEHLLKTSSKLEQEAIEASYILQQLHRALE